MNNEQPRGVFHKYNITKRDGSPAIGQYFVLKLDSKNPDEQRAVNAAMTAYATSIQSHNPALASDLRDMGYIGDANKPIWHGPDEVPEVGEEIAFLTPSGKLYAGCFQGITERGIIIVHYPDMEYATADVFKKWAYIRDLENTK